MEQPQPYPCYDDEIDLKKFIRPLIRYWYWIAGAVFLAALAAYLVSSLLTPTYEANVDLATAKLKVEVQFGTEIQTLSEEELAARGAASLFDRKARLQGYAALALNPAIAEQVLPLFSDQLAAIDKGLLNPSRFISNRVECKVLSNTDVIRITVSLPDAELTAAVANAWGKAYEEHINRLYGGGSSQDQERARSQTEQAYSEYQAAQETLEAFIAENPIPDLEREVAVRRAQIEALQQEVWSSRAQVPSRELSARRSLLDGYYSDWVMIQQLLEDAESLQRKFEAGAVSPSGAFADAFALISLQSRIYGPAAGTIELQMPFSIEPENVNANDVDVLVDVLQEECDLLESRIDEITEDLLAAPSNQIPDKAGDDLRVHLERLSEEMQEFEADLEAERAHQQNLLQQRDLAWETYSTLSKKEVEVRVAAATGGTEVKLASPAAVPAKPTSPKPLLNSALAGTIGGILAMFGVYVVRYMGDED
jgi:uncharacterized protein involved in exopolysaccharide biosynthesis